MKNKIFSFLPFLVFALCLALLPAATEGSAKRPQGEHHTRPPHHANPPHYNIPVWVDIYEDEEDDDDGTIPYEIKADGTIVVAPNSPSRWITSVDVGANRFSLSAPISFPKPITSADIAQIRTVFNSSVDRKSVDTLLNGDMTGLTAAGKVASGGSLNRVELIQIIVERTDGRTFIQNLSIGLDF